MDKLEYNTEFIQLLLDYGVDVEHREIYLTGTMDDDSISRCVKTLNYLDKEVAPIKLYISSSGGNFVDMMRLYDTITTTESRVETIAMGECSSSAVLILAAGDKGFRSAGQNTQLMLHDVWEEVTTDMSAAALVVEGDNIEDCHMLWASLLEFCSTEDRDFWHNKIQAKPFYFTANQAKQYGLIDEIRQTDRL